MDFDLFCARQDWQPVFYETPEETAPAYRTAGFRTFKVAEDACIDLKAFTVSGGKFQNLRTALNKIRKAGWRYEWFCGGALEPSLQASLRAISDEWLSARHGAEMTFDLGSFAPESLKRAELCVLFDEKNLPTAFVSWLPYAQATGRSLDLMRHLSIHRGVMDALIAESLLDFQRRGLFQASLGNAPLANIESGSLDSLEEKVIRYLFERFEAYYGYKSLFEFKNKFRQSGGVGMLPTAALLTYCLRRRLSCVCICQAVFSNTFDPESGDGHHQNFSKEIVAPSQAPALSYIRVLYFRGERDFGAHELAERQALRSNL